MKCMNWRNMQIANFSWRCDYPQRNSCRKPTGTNKTCTGNLQALTVL